MDYGVAGLKITVGTGGGANFQGGGSLWWQRIWRRLRKEGVLKNMTGWDISINPLPIGTYNIDPISPDPGWNPATHL